ncbi:hypothetical protein NWQ33_04260 [Mycoplasmopsis cynos]|nr:hypothetical protein [Mycoplasmopsis cynos]
MNWCKDQISNNSCKTATPASSVNAITKATANNNGNEAKTGSPSDLIRSPNNTRPELDLSIPAIAAPTPKNIPAIDITEIGSKNAPEIFERVRLNLPESLLLSFSLCSL